MRKMIVFLMIISNVYINNTNNLQILNSIVFKKQNGQIFICKTFDYNLMNFAIHIDDIQHDSLDQISFHGYVYGNVISNGQYEQRIPDKSLYSCIIEKDEVYIVDLLTISDKNGEFHVNNFVYKEMALLVENDDSTAVVTYFYMEDK